MQLRYTKTAFTALWSLAVVVAALIGNLTSTFNWIVLAALSVVPPAILWRLWNPPVPSMSESIREALRD
jgi:hypothetical protein